MPSHLTLFPRLGRAALWAAALLAPAYAGTPLATWTFETSAPAGPGPVAPELGAGVATASTGGAWTNPVGNGSAESWNSNRWDGGDYFQFTVDGTGYKSFEISWSQIGSGKGPRDFSLSYSLDGVTYIWLMDYVVLANTTPNNWGLGAPAAATIYGFELDLPKPVAGNIFFRLTAISMISTTGEAVAVGGTSRVDDVAISGGESGGGR